MSEIVRAKVEQETVKNNRWTNIRMFLVNEATGEEMADDEVQRLFEEDRLVGVWVKTKKDPSDPIYAEYGLGGKIFAIDDEVIILSGMFGQERIPKEIFHELYRLD